MAIMKSVRRLFSKRAPLELTISTSPSENGEPPNVVLEPVSTSEDDTPASSDLSAPDPLDAMNSISRIEESICESGTTQAAMLETLQQLPELNRHASLASERQQELNELIRGLATAEHERGAMAKETTQHISECLDRHNDTLALVQRQLDANHQIASHNAEHLSSLSEAIRSSITTQHKTGEAVCAMADQFRIREAKMSAKFSRIQGWLIASIIASMGTLIAAVTLAWIIFGSKTT